MRKAQVGAPFGATFHVRKNGLERSVGAAPSAAAVLVESAACDDPKDNRDLRDDNRAQQVDAAQIAAMRSEGKTGEAIIEALVAGSETWANKTEFSKAKWLKRKQKKHMPWVKSAPGVYTYTHTLANQTSTRP